MPRQHLLCPYTWAQRQPLCRERDTPAAEPPPPRGFAQQKPRPCQSQHRLLPLWEEAERSSEPSLRPKRKPPPASSDAVALGVFASSPPSFESALSAAHWEQKPPQAPPREATEFPFGPTPGPSEDPSDPRCRICRPCPRGRSAGAPSRTGSPRQPWGDGEPLAPSQQSIWANEEWC